MEFFESLAQDLIGNPDWVHWFSFPFTKKPENDPTFEVFFTKQWLETLVISFQNFLNSIFQSMPLPALLNFNIERLKRKSLESEVESLRIALDNIRAAQETSGLDYQLPSQNPLPSLNMNTRIKSKAPLPTELLSPSRPADPQKKLGENREASTLTPSKPPIRKSISFEVEKTEALVSEPVEMEFPKVGLDDEEPFHLLSQEVFSGHEAKIIHCKFSTENTLVGSVDSDNILQIWSPINSPNFPTSKLRIPSPVQTIEWESKTDRVLFLGTSERSLYVCNTESRSITSEFQSDPEFPRSVALASHPTDARVVHSISSFGKNPRGSLTIWNIRALKAESSFNIDGDVAPINSMRFNHNGKLLATGDSQGRIRIFDMNSMTSIMEWQAHTSEIISIQFSFDEASIYSLSSEGQLKQWILHRLDEMQNEGVRLVHFPTNVKVNVAFDNTMQYILSTTGKNHATISEVKTGEPIRYLSGHSQPVVCVDWSQEGSLCLTGSEDSSIRLSKLAKV